MLLLLLLLVAGDDESLLQVVVSIAALLIIVPVVVSVVATPTEAPDNSMLRVLLCLESKNNVGITLSLTKTKQTCTMFGFEMALFLVVLSCHPNLASKPLSGCRLISFWGGKLINAVCVFS